LLIGFNCKTSVQLQSTNAQTPPKIEEYQRPESKTNQQLAEPDEICKTSIPGSNPGGASITPNKSADRGCVTGREPVKTQPGRRLSCTYRVEEENRRVQRPYSDTDLMAYSAEHVAYEVRMFFQIVEIIEQRGAGRDDTTASLPTFIGSSWERERVATDNTCVESFMTHLRNLIAFLFDLHPRPTDVAAMDFCHPGVWQPTASPSLNDARRRVDKELAHLTTNRMSGSSPRKRWDVTGLAQELTPVLHDFAAKALTSRLSPQVKAAIR
jgi:hypothetical protein